MALTDEEISQVLNAADVDPAEFAAVVGMAGIESEGDPVADVRALAEGSGLEVEELLYGLFSEEHPLFSDDAWDEPLTSPWDEER